MRGKSIVDPPNFKNMSFNIRCVWSNLFLCFSLGSRASNYGLVKFDYAGRVLQFFEKPMGADLESMVSTSLSTAFVSFISLMNLF